MSKSRVGRIAQLTPGGRGAIATLLVQGRGAVEVAGRFFHAASGRALASLPIGRIAFGRWAADDDGAGDDGAEKHAGEELIVCRTEPDSLEIHCHGGRAAIEAISQSLLAAGCTSATWREIAAGQYADPIAAEVRAALAGAKTQRAAAILLDQMHGALGDALRSIDADLAAGRMEPAHDALVALRDRAAVGRRLTSAFRVVIAGRPNVGKSSLTNALLGFGRAIVFDQPGTTRDVLAATTAVDGWPIELCDTAGLRDAGDEIEQQGVGRARRAAESADLVVLVFDASSPLSPEDERLMACYPNALNVGNKCDLPIDPDVSSHVELFVSAKTGECIADLTSRIAQQLVPQPPHPGDAMPFTERQQRAIEAAIEAIHHADSAAAREQLTTLTSEV